MSKKHVCTKDRPMRSTSNPDDWSHPDAGADPAAAYFTFGNPDEDVEVEVNHRVCPHCDAAELFRTGRTEPRQVMP